jgi:formate-nitrite transporter family protein
VMTGVIPWMRWLTGYMLPVLIGNCLGGVSLVAVINHAQVFAGEQQKKV